MKATDIQAIINSHESYWQLQQPDMKDYTNMYRVRMWQRAGKRNNGWALGTSDLIFTETPDGHNQIETLVASAFPKAPAVAISSGPDERGNPALAQEICNRWLSGRVEIIKMILRNALLYPFSGIKLAFQESAVSVMDAVDMDPLQPWEMIVDMDAKTWDKQRYCGHMYYLDVPTARQNWPRIKWRPSHRQDYLTQYDPASGFSTVSTGWGVDSSREAARTGGDPDADGGLLSYVQIYEIYDLRTDEVVWWSPNAIGGDTPAGRVLKKVSGIPIRDRNDRPVAPIVPFYVSQDPQAPLKGGSYMGRIYDLLREINNLRTYWSNAVRRDNRTYVVGKGTLDDDAKTTLVQNLDQSFVEIETSVDNPSVVGRIVPLENPPISVDLTRYENEIRSDLERSNNLASFTRGQATNSTATEIQMLQQYSSNMIGMIARARDSVIEIACDLYLQMMRTLLADPETPYKPETVTVEGTATVISESSLDGKMRIYAADQSSTPLSSALKRQQAVELAPTLMQTGADPKEILKMIVRAYELSPSLIPVEQADPSTQPVSGGGVSNATGTPGEA